MKKKTNSPKVQSYKNQNEYLGELNKVFTKDYGKKFSKGKLNKIAGNLDGLLFGAISKKQKKLICLTIIFKQVE